MSSANVKGWIANSAAHFDDDEGNNIKVFDEDFSNDLNWEAFKSNSRSQLMTSSTKSRCLFLETTLTPLISRPGLTAKQRTQVFDLLTLTYPRYIDFASRRAAENCLRKLISLDLTEAAAILTNVIDWLAEAVGGASSRASTAPHNQYVLLSWGCMIYSSFIDKIIEISDSLLKKLLLALAILLESLLDKSSNVKDSLRHSATAKTRRAVRSQPEMIPSVIKAQLITAKTSTTPHIFAPFLGLSADVALYLRPVKGRDLDFGKSIVESFKSDILTYYGNQIIMARSLMPKHVSGAFHEFFKIINSNDFDGILLPIVEKALLRSPEYSLSTVADLLGGYARPLSNTTFSKLCSATLSNAKSANPTTRTEAARLFTTMVQFQEDAQLNDAVVDILTLPIANKTSGVDHRKTLYAMLNSVRSGPQLSSQVVQALPALIIKETDETALIQLAHILSRHITYQLQQNHVVDSAVTTAISKELTSNKPALRRAFCLIAGNALWPLRSQFTNAAATFRDALINALDSCYKSVSNNPLSLPAGPLEGYVAITILLGPIREKNNIFTSTMQGILSTSSTKPHFLLWHKCYQKLATAEDERWFLHALDVVLSRSQTQIENNEVLRSQFGSALLHFGIESKNLDIRQTVITLIQTYSSQMPLTINLMVRQALLQRLSQFQTSGQTAEQDDNHRRRCYALLSASLSLGDDVNISARERLVSQNVIISHHQAIVGASRSPWIELCQIAKVDPRVVIQNNLSSIISSIWEYTDSLKHPMPTVTAGFHAITTLVFVAPTLVLPTIISQITDDLNPAILEAVTMEDYNIWKTPDGQLYANVLEKQKPRTVEKGKDSELRKWEAELRKSLANKKPGDTSLSKQDQALVNAQLAKESQKRAQLTGIKARAERGLELVKNIIKASVPEFHPYITVIVNLLTQGMLTTGSKLLGPALFETYVSLADVCSDRLDTFRRWIGISTLRCLEVKCVPEALTEEPVNLLTIRVLYRLKSYAEQNLLDLATYCYANPLITLLMETNASNAADADEALEQLTLALDFVKHHCDQFRDDQYPRRTTIKSLLHVIRNNPQLAQTAVSCLVDLGSAMRLNPSRDEVNDLLQGVLSQESLARNASLQVLQTFDLTDLDWSPELWIACHDDDEQCSRLAEFIWEDNGLDVPEGYLASLIPHLAHEHSNVRTSCAYAISEAAKAWPQNAESTITALQNLYEEKAKPLAPELDEYGMVIAETIGRADPWPARLAVARSFEALAPVFPSDSVVPWFRFLLSGNAALGDQSAEVRKGLLAAGTAVLDTQGAPNLPDLITLFEACLQATSTSETGDHLKEAAVILFGRLARHLDKTDPRVPMVVDRLVEALKTPSESVQIAVSDCLVPLARMMKQNAAQLVDSLFNDMLNAPKYAARRGAAYGLAGVVKGFGISAMKTFNIIERLRAALEDKKKPENRQGALFAFETFSATLDRLFEPYVIYLIPQLLSAFGDASTDVREATQDAAKVIMGNMSGYGVKLILPSLLSGLDEKQWRTKKGSIELLGSMAFCSPTQLSLSLPTVIPKLTGVLTDSHAQVRGAANQSLKQFGEVISNPEIQSLVPVLLKALSDPAKGPAALTALLKTSFAHYIDGSSLALVIPIVERGLRERGSETKRKAARIVGNMTSLTDPKDFVPYLSRLLPLVHVCLVDPVPEARATAAKALGTLVERLGEAHFPDLVPGLLRTLKSDVSGVDRQGAAQGLSEVLAGLGMDRLEGLLPDIIANANSSRPHVKEGFMSLLVFLPATFGVRFQPHLPQIIQPILNGLADSEEVVRDAALKAGRMIIVNYSNRAIDLLLPELEIGMFDSSWRIRQSSVTLVGELLFKLAGISGKSEMEEEEEMAAASAADSSRRVLTDLLGPERRDRILAGLYILRQDDITVVRMASIQVWKALVQNTPRTVREMLPSVISRVLYLLPNPDSDQERMASATLSELCRKLGEKVFVEIVHILQTNSKSSDDRTREAVCLALVHVLQNTLESHREGKEDELIPIVRKSLVDKAPSVRSAAAQAFDMLQEAYGAKAIDETIPTLLEALRQPDENSNTALKALREVMNVRANVVFPILIPTLIAPPITAFNARALASLVTVAGSALTKRLTTILEALLSALESEECTIRPDIIETLRAIMSSVTDGDALHVLMLQLLAWAKDSSPARRASCMKAVQLFFSESKADTSYYSVDWIVRLTMLLDDRVDEVVHAAWAALDTFVKSVPKEDLESLVVALRKNLESIGAPGRVVPGLSIEGPGRGPAPIVPIILAGLTSGTNEQREYAAYAIGDLVERTSETALKPFVVPLTGPLIRVATQSASLPPPVKTAILTALTVMLDKIPSFVKPFFPQLQRTFVKLLLDSTSSVVRTRAADALGSLMCSVTRVDPVVVELITMSKSNDDPIAASCILALSNVVKNASQYLSDSSKSAISELLNEVFHENHEENYITSTSLLFTHFANSYPDLPAIRTMTKSHIVDGNPSMLTSHIIVNVLTHAPGVFYKMGGGEGENGTAGGGGSNPYVIGVLRKIQASLSENGLISRPAREARELVKVAEPWCYDLEGSGL